MKDGVSWRSLNSRWIFVFVFLLFAGLRVAYWLSINEEPFSDMADYYAIAQRVWCCFSFEHDPFWRSYKPPGMALLAAPIVGPFPGYIGLWFWRVFSTLILFGSALFLSRELGSLLRSRAAPLVFLLVLALSKSSIFWSYRFSTESLSEALTYLTLAMAIALFRHGAISKSLTSIFWRSFGLGIATISLVLVRPNMMTFLAVIPAGLVLNSMVGIRHYAAVFPIRRIVIGQLVGFLTGVFLMWTPWICRGYQLYGTVVPFSTQGPYSFLWEADGFFYDDPQLGRRNVNADTLQREAPTRFATDVEAAAIAKIAGRQWLVQKGYLNFVWLVIKRLGVMVTEREISLAKTPRKSLFADYKDNILIDKSVLVVALALLGAFVGILVYGAPYMTVVLCIWSPIFLSACFMGEPRMLEPFIPILLFMAIMTIGGTLKVATSGLLRCRRA